MDRVISFGEAQEFLSEARSELKVTLERKADEPG